MNDQEWTAFLDTLTPAHRKLAQGVLARLEYVLERFRSQMLSDIQRIERRLAHRDEREAGDGTPGG